MVARDAVRFSITIAGVGMAVVLILFLLALYNGVRVEANGWVSSRPVDGWVAQSNTTNFIKSSSMLDAALEDSVRTDPGVEEVTSLLRLITLIEAGPRHLTAIVVGIDPASAAGRPDVVEGQAQVDSAGLILDWALAKRLHTSVGDSVQVEGRTFRVTGVSRGTNSVLTQYAFVTLPQARALLGFPDVASYLLVRTRAGVAPGDVLQRLRARFPDVAVIAQATFAENNMDEMRGGLIPILTTVAVLGAIVAAAVLTLLLYGSVLERREDYALLKAIGAPSRVLGWVMLAQAVAAVCGGLVVGSVVYALAVPISAHLAPAVPLSLSWRTVALVVSGSLATGIVGALLPLARIARIHPAEVFRA
ncbi:MAG: ABC transporter permease [Gemmatimonadota bacterium]